ncbi:hypothetical protein [Burkholderia sp. AW49-1]
MKSITPALFFTTAAFLLGPPSLYAASDSCGCNAGLVKEVMKREQSSRVSLAFLKQIDQRQFEELKKDASLGGYYGIIGGSATYGEFNQKRNSYLESVNYKLDASQSDTLLIDTVKTEEWSSCKKICITQQQGFSCDVVDVTDDTAIVGCSWRPVQNEEPRTVTIISNQNFQKAELLAPHYGQTTNWHVPRVKNKDLAVTATLQNGPSQTLKIPAVPVVMTELKNVALGSCIGRGGLQGVHFWGPVGESCNGLPGKPWGDYLQNPSKQVTQLCSCTGHGGVNGVRMWGPAGEDCAGIPIWGKYDQQCVPVNADFKACACGGHGNVLDGHTLWGPKDAECGGMPDDVWGKYSQYCVGSSTVPITQK